MKKIYLFILTFMVVGLFSSCEKDNGLSKSSSKTENTTNGGSGDTSSSASKEGTAYCIVIKYFHSTRTTTYEREDHWKEVTNTGRVVLYSNSAKTNRYGYATVNTSSKKYGYDVSMFDYEVSRSVGLDMYYYYFD